MEAEADRRTVVAKEILASEVDYLRTLDVIKHTFFLPLKNALASNRAITSSRRSARWHEIASQGRGRHPGFCERALQIHRDRERGLLSPSGLWPRALWGRGKRP